MALFQKKPDAGKVMSLYSIGANKTVIIVGLGNPGKRYESTCHNVGFGAVDYFASKNNFPAWITKKDLKCDITIANLGESRVVLCKPKTFMNLSGQAVSALQRFYQVYNAQTLAVYDELAIPFGQLRTRAGGSAAGHNGVKSLIELLGEDFGRLRIGIGTKDTKEAEPTPRQANASKFVLSKFSREEQASLPKIYREANAMITEFIFGEQLLHDTRIVL